MKTALMSALVLFVSVTVGLGQSFRIGGHGAYFSDLKVTLSDDRGTFSYDSEWGYGAQLEGRFNKYFGIELAGSFFNQEIKETGYDDYFDEELTVVAGLDNYVLLATLKFYLPVNDYFGFYFGGGAGYFILDEYYKASSASSVIEDEKGNVLKTWGYQGCVGAEVMLGKHFSLFGDYRYSRFDDIWRNAANYGTEDVDVRYEFSFARVGVNVVF